MIRGPAVVVDRAMSMLNWLVLTLLLAMFLLAATVSDQQRTATSTEPVAGSTAISAPAGSGG